MSGNVSPNPKKLGVAAPSTGDLNDICVAGITPFTTIDFPGRLAGVFYLQGCPWRCRYCYNAEFWPMPSEGHLIPLEKIMEFLHSRQKNLDGIVFSGGEPTIHEHLPVWMKAIKAMGYEVGLHTNGMFPEHLRKILPLCDWVGMDIKAPFSLYEKVTLIPDSGEPVRRSAGMLVASGVPYEFRTTFHPDILSEDEVLQMARELVSMGCKSYALQMFRANHCSDKGLCDVGVLTAGISANLRQTLKPLFQNFQIRE